MEPPTARDLSIQIDDAVAVCAARQLKPQPFPPVKEVDERVRRGQSQKCDQGEPHGEFNRRAETECLALSRQRQPPAAKDIPPSSECNSNDKCDRGKLRPKGKPRLMPTRRSIQRDGFATYSQRR